MEVIDLSKKKKQEKKGIIPSEFVDFHSPNPNPDNPGNSVNVHRMIENANIYFAEKELGQQNENNG